MLFINAEDVMILALVFPIVWLALSGLGLGADSERIDAFTSCVELKDNCGLFQYSFCIDHQSLFDARALLEGT